MGWVYVLGSIMETLGSLLLSSNVIKKIVAGIINIQAYQSNRTEEMLMFAFQYSKREEGIMPEQQLYLIKENMLLIGKLFFLTTGTSTGML
jgi:hypothetical protein